MKTAKPKVDPLIKSRAKAIVKEASGSNTFTCVASTCTYPKCGCGLPKQDAVENIS